MKSGQIVLIEDNPADLLLVRKALEENGIEHALLRFESGADAIRVLCAETKGEVFVPDAILLDLNTPRTDGFEISHRLREFPRF
jgi:CheY-like chemotaxis protein